MLDKAILNTLRNGDMRWTALEKKVLTTCHSLATRTRFDNRLRYLLNKEYVERVSRGVYRITEKGTKYMEVI
jgi:DNA-binding HxlR family transcriptional regulator